MTHGLRAALFTIFRKTYSNLARTPLRNIPGMSTLSNVLFRSFWMRGNIIDVQGSKMYINVSDPHPSMRKTFQAYGMNLIHEEATTALFKKIVKPGDVVLDLGANIGYFSLLAARLVGKDGRVFAFEPEPTNFHYLTKNVILNNYTNLFGFQKAVSDKTGKTKLFICLYDSGHHTINQYDGIEENAHGRLTEKQWTEIDTVALDEFLEDKTERVDVIKMDVEGADALALAGMRETLMRNQNIKVFAEFFPLLMKKMGSDPYVYAQSLLHDFGFAIFAIGHDYDLRDSKEELIRITSAKDLFDLLRGDGSHINLYLTRG